MPSIKPRDFTLATPLLTEWVPWVNATLERKTTVSALLHLYDDETATLTNKSITKAQITDFPHTHIKSDITDTPWAKGDLPSVISYEDEANTFGDFNQTFKDNRILIESPDGLTPTTLINSQQTLARNLTIPILTGNRNIIVTGESNQIGDTEINTHTTTKISTTSKSLLNSAIVYNDQANIFGDFDQTFKDNRVRIENPAGTFEVQLQTSAEIADRILTIPLLGADRTMIVTGLANQVGDTEIATHATTKISTTSKSLLNSAIVYNDQTNAFGDFEQSFKDNQLKIFNPADTFRYTLVASAISAARNLTLPLLTGDDVMVTADFIQTLTNKTVNATNNTITDTSQAAGDILKNNGSKFVRMARGAALQVLRVNSGGTDLEYAAAGAADNLGNHLATQDIDNDTFSHIFQERAEPASPATNNIALFAFDSGLTQLRTKDEYGLLDPISWRNPYSLRKDFLITHGSDTTSAAEYGQFNILVTTSEGTLTVVNNTGTGQRRNFATAATLDTDGGFLTGGYTTRDANPDVTIKFAAVSALVRRIWIGWVEADHMGSDSTAATHKFALRLSTSPAVTGFTIVHSDGTTETVEAQIQASDTAIHTIRLVADNANSRFGYSFDNAAIVWITTNIPSATNNLLLQCQVRTLEAVTKNFEVWWARGTTEK